MKRTARTSREKRRTRQLFQHNSLEKQDMKTYLEVSQNNSKVYIKTSLIFKESPLYDLAVVVLCKLLCRLNVMLINVFFCFEQIAHFRKQTSQNIFRRYVQNYCNYLQFQQSGRSFFSGRASTSIPFSINECQFQSKSKVQDQPCLHFFD